MVQTLQFQQVFFAELSQMIRIHARYALESVSGRDAQDVVDLIPGILLTGIPGRRTLRSDSMDLNSDDSGILRESEVWLVLLRVLA